VEPINFRYGNAYFCSLGADMKLGNIGRHIVMEIFSTSHLHVYLENSH